MLYRRGQHTGNSKSKKMFGLYWILVVMVVERMLLSLLKIDFDHHLLNFVFTIIYKISPIFLKERSTHTHTHRKFKKQKMFGLYWILVVVVERMLLLLLLLLLRIIDLLMILIIYLNFFLCYYL